MCKMWERIRFGARWCTAERTALAMRGVDLKNVKSIHFSFDPFYHDCHALRYHDIIHFFSFHKKI